MADRGLGAAERKTLRALRSRRRREASGLFLAEGVRVVEELIGAGIVPEIAVVSAALEDDQRGRALASSLREQCAVRIVAEHELARLADAEASQGVIVAAPIPARDAATIALPERCSALLLDGIQDPGNFGALVRCALAFAVPLVIALPGTVDAWNPKAVRAAAGASFHVPILALTAGAAEAWLAAHGFAIFVAAAAGTPVTTLAAPRRVALALGNEGAGVSESLRRAADAVVAVPMPGPAESLNVAVAAGILLFALSERP
jgi:RNA methyltransferase, TrmH family